MNWPIRSMRKAEALTGHPQLFVQNLRTALIILDLDGRITHFNRAAELFSGYLAGEVLGRHAWDFLIAKDDAEVLKQAFEDLKATGLQMEMDATWITRDGRQHIMRWSNAPVTDEYGRLRWVVDTYVDITAERDTEKKLELKREELEIERLVALFLSEFSYRMSSAPLDRNSRLAMAVAIAVPTLADWSVAALKEKDKPGCVLKAFHRDPEKLVALQSLMSREEAGAAITALRGVRSSEREPNLDPLRALTAGNGTLARELGWESWMSIPILGAQRSTQGTLLLVGGKDGRRSPMRGKARIAEDFVRRLTPHLDSASLYEDANRALCLRDEFIGVAAHELRTPLTSLRMQVQLLRRGDNLLSETLDLINRIDHQLERIGRIVGEIVDTDTLAKGQLRLDLTEVDLRQLVGGVLRDTREFAAALDTPIVFEEGESVFGKCDRFRIEQVVTHLITNAIKFAQKTRIIVRVRHQETRLIIEVEDQGPGIPLDDQERIFARFERTLNHRPMGLGLGLFISREIARAHHGNLRVESSPGKGAKFILELPV